MNTTIRVSSTVVLLCSVCPAQEPVEVFHDPGVGFFGSGDDGDSFLDVTPTDDGAVVTLFLKAGGPNPPLYVGFWKADQWTKLKVDSLKTVGDRIVEDSINPFGDIGGIGLKQGFELVHPPTTRREFYAVGLEANYSFFFCKDDNGEYAYVCTGEYTLEYSVTPFPTPLNGDFNYDDAVDNADFLILREWFASRKHGLSWQNGDATLDGEIDFADFQVLAVNYGSMREPVAAVPEPSALLLLASACVCRRRLVRKP